MWHWGAFRSLQPGCFQMGTLVTLFVSVHSCADIIKVIANVKESVTIFVCRTYNLYVYAEFVKFIGHT